MSAPTFPAAAAAVWLVVLLLLTPGCATRPGAGVTLWNPATWFSAREARAADRAETRATAAADAETAARDELLRVAQRAAHEAVLALLSAPPSRPVEVAAESATHTADTLDQALGALPATTQTAIRAQIAALLSDNATLRADGEATRAALRERDATASRDLAQAARDRAAADAIAQAARADLRSAYDRENALANELRDERFQRWLATAGTVLATIAALAYRYNLGGLTDGIARGLADLRKKNPGTADLATTALDIGLNRSEQTAISRRVTTLLSAS